MTEISNPKETCSCSNGKKCTCSCSKGECACSGDKEKCTCSCGKGAESQTIEKSNTDS